MEHTLHEPRIPSFWTLQLGGWSVYCVLAAIATIPFNHARDYVADRATFMLGEFLKSFVMYALCHALWKRRTPLFRSLLSCIALACPLGIAYQAVWGWAANHVGSVHTELTWSSVFTEGIGSSFVLMAWCAFYFGVKYYQAMERQRLQLLASEVLAQEAQLRALRYQLQPHFIFNTLNSISTLVLDNQPRAATQMIAKLGNLLRSTLDSPDTHQIALMEEIAVTDEYLAIERTRLGSRLAVSFEIDPDTNRARVPRFLLQPLVENAIRHGIARHAQGGQILIRADKLGTHLYMRIENEGYGRHRPLVSRTPSKFGGLGLANTRTRLQQIYGTAATLEATACTDSKYVVLISLPFSIDGLDRN